jgi:hypothetical protein
VLLVSLALIHAYWSDQYHAHGEEELPCIDYKTEKLAVVRVEACGGFMQSISSLLLFEGYHIDVGIFGYSEVARIYMTR